MTLHSAILDFLEAAEQRNCAASTRQSYGAILGQLEAFCGAATELPAIDRRKLKAFLAHLNGLKPSTKAVRVSVLKHFFAHAVREEWITHSPAEHLEYPHFRVADRQPYTDAEIEAILGACQTPQERALVSLMRHTGLRVSDAVAFRKDQIRGDCVMLRAKKNGRELSVPLPAAVLEQLGLLGDTWLFARPGSRRREPRPVPGPTDRGGRAGGNGKAPSLATWRKQLGAVYRRSGVRGAISHRWRHSLCSRLAAKGVPLGLIAEIVGISEAVLTKHYAKWLPEKGEAIRRALEAAGD